MGKEVVYLTIKDIAEVKRFAIERKIMTLEYFDQIEKQLTQYKPQQLTNVLELLANGSTVPFIARYRKENTGNLDEVQIREIEQRYQYIENIEVRRTSILKNIDEQGKLTAELEKKIKSASVMQKLEDLYTPFKQKRRTKATVAKESGLEPLAEWLFSNPTEGNIEDKAAAFINEAVEITSIKEALKGAHEIMAEWMSENADIKQQLRSYAQQYGKISSIKLKKAVDESQVYAVYYDFTENIKQLKSYQVLAINRAEKEKVVKATLVLDEGPAVVYMERYYIKPNSISATYIHSAIKDALKRFLLPATEREIRTELTSEAEDSAIATFSENLQNLLMQAPLKGRTILGLDPAFRTGCKLAVIDKTGKVLDKTVIYPHKPVNKSEAAKQTVLELIAKYGIEMIAIGNGTASRESELFVADLIKENHLETVYAIVNESGASVYSASEIARQEFPDYNVEERSAVSIARRLQDPLAELVKIDPKAIGVGQYQHDVSQKKLADSLDFTVEMGVNRVGVNLNTASVPLLEHVSGLTKAVAKNVIIHREEIGLYTNRNQLKDVPRLGPKAFEQSAGFLRIVEGDNILDNTGIHPESYKVTKQILSDLNINLDEIQTDENRAKIEVLDVLQLASPYNVDQATLKDIKLALLTPGRDLRDDIAAPILRSDALTMEDLQIGMQLQGTVRNVVDFGAFVDIGVKQDGLVHISHMSNKFINHPREMVAVGDIIDIWILEIETNKGRIGLSMMPIK